MTQFDPPTGPGGPSPERSMPGAAPPVHRRGLTIGMIAIAAVVVGAEGYRLMSGSLGGPAQAQGPGAPNNAPQFVKKGDEITIPDGSPLRGKLVIAPVVEKEVQRSLVLPAVVETNPSRTVKVLPPVAGRVVELKVELGARVAKGDELAVIESGDVAAAISDAEKARAAEKLAKQTLDRLLALEKTRAVAVKDREQAQNDYAQAQAELRRSEDRLRAIGIAPETTEPTRLLVIKSPISGSVIDLQMAAGDFLNDPTAAVATIANLDTVWVTANVPEKDTALVTKGQSVDVVFTAYPNEIFKGNVLFVSDILDADTRRTKVRIAFRNPDFRLKPNMFANATFLAPSRNVPSIPTTALILREEVDQVFVEVEPWVFEPRPVEVAFQQDDRAVIGRGLKAGDRIVVKGGVLLND